MAAPAARSQEAAMSGQRDNQPDGNQRGWPAQPRRPSGTATVALTTRRRWWSRRWVALAGVVALVAGGLVAVQVAPGTRAAAIPNLKLVVSDTVGPDSLSAKGVNAICPEDYQIVGGGGWADDFNAGVVMLTRLKPNDTEEGTPTLLDTYQVRAQEPATGFAGAWSLTAYAVCAPEFPDAGYEVVRGAIGASPSDTFKTTAAACPEGKQVVGTGAEVTSIAESGRVGLVLNRGSGPLDISRALAREISPYNDSWGLFSWAVCRYLPNVTAEGTGSSAAGGHYTCADPEDQLHSFGVGGGLTDTGPFFLPPLHPFDGT